MLSARLSEKEARMYRKVRLASVVEEATQLVVWLPDDARVVVNAEIGLPSLAETSWWVLEVGPEAQSRTALADLGLLAYRGVAFMRNPVEVNV
jgi:hypothetical protein